MNDRHLENLLRMAHEAEELDRSARAGHAAYVIPVWRRWVLGVGGLAAAAALAITVVHGTFASKPVVHSPVRIASSDHVRVQPVKAHTLSDEELAAVQRALADLIDSTDDAAGDRDEALVIAISGAPDDRSCECVRWRRVELPRGRELADLTRGELLRLGLQESCSPHAGKLLVVAVASDAISLNAETADRVAACLNGQSCGEVGSCYATAALACLPPDATVVAETLALAR